MTPVEPYWLDVENCKVDPVYDVPGGKRPGTDNVHRAVWDVPKGGRLVAAGGHVHGGGEELALRRPSCGRAGDIYTSRPTWGGPRHPFYRVRPVLHEPGPIHMSGFNSGTGVPLAAGERVVLDSRYDASLPHTRVMGIMIAYMAPDSSVTAPCGARPSDLAEAPAPAGRRSPPPFRVPIVGRRGGKAVNIDAPPGRRVRLGRRGTIEVGDLFFRRPNVSVRAGAKLTWRFEGDSLHNITLANGPRGFSSPNLSRRAHVREEAERAGHLPDLLRASSRRHDGDREGHPPPRLISAARSSSAEFASRFFCGAPEAGHLPGVARVEPRLRLRRELEAAHHPVRHERPVAVLLHEVAAHLEVPLPAELGVVVVRGEAGEPGLHRHAHRAARDPHAAGRAVHRDRHAHA